MKRRSKNRGLTTVELLMASTISAGVLFTSVMLFLFGMAQWSRGEAHIAADSGSQVAVRAIAAELREAMAVTVDSDGLGLSYRLPKKNGSGDWITPVEWDGVSRRIFYENGEVRITGDKNRVLCEHVVLNDPQWDGNHAYKVFSAGAGSITRQLTIMVVTKTNEYKNEWSTSRSRETIYLRNVPELTGT